MIDLQQVSGLPLKFDEDKNVLIFGEGLQQVMPTARTHKEMLPVLMDKDSKGPNDFYLMYRDVHLDKDEQIIRENDLRFDITVIPAATIGKEIIKTFGHFHVLVEGKNITYPEVYAVLYGEAHYLLQKGDKDVKDFIVLKVKAGEKAVIPPGYGHVTVNAGASPLVMANWVSDRFSSKYGPVKECSGFAYYETSDGFVKNNKYTTIPEIRTMKAVQVPEFGLNEKPMYTQGIEEIEKLDWLNNPDKYPEEIKKSLVDTTQ